MATRPASGRDLAIRPYRGTDRDALIDLWQRCGLVVPYNDPDADIALYQATPSAEILVGTRGEHIVASVAVGSDGHRGWLYYVGVDPRSQRKGYGRALVRRAEIWLSERQVRKVQVIIRENNLAVRRFYARLGYQPNPSALMQRWLTEADPGPTLVRREDGRIACTITYLEMTAKPRLPHVSAPRGCAIALLRAHRPPVPFYRYLYDRVGEPWLWYERRAFSEDELRAIVQDDRVEIYVLYVDGVPAGYAELDRRRAPEIELAYFGLMPEFIGRGLGAYLLTSVIDLAWSYEPSRLLVNTNTLDHPKALSLYQRCGFAPYRQEQTLLDDPRADGLIAG